MILDSIVADKMDELERQQEAVPLAELKATIEHQRPPLDFATALVGDGVRLIAEVKKASPSKGVLHADLDPARLADTYASAGAAAISILTESRYFQGSLENLAAIRARLPNIPLLRKDFILKPYQVFESRARGADALLLITAVLDDAGLEELLSLSHDLGMPCLVEVHNEAELKRALACPARIIGINNRNLKTMSVDLAVTRRLRPLIPPDRIVVSESGIKGPGDIRKLREWGVDAVLIGEALATAGDVTAKIKELFDQD
jgi:indole-3-glycerol phosphate synthase